MSDEICPKMESPPFPPYDLARESSPLIFSFKIFFSYLKLSRHPPPLLHHPVFRSLFSEKSFIMDVWQQPS